ncbi:uncharacterized protein [Populus alba]|uniref:DUF7731 domain-containing protein n=2 Tax=Populus TaxID=3689 RepID=A0A4U5PZG8_POPAL|nr:uncharacterized protein LOC118062489 isoform X1 [Populus alba]KAJ6987836.1 hypothetical protein NC653_020934 [Populus alba x Populus x berolinensis]TKS03068.1 uncharacterized protein D5086_0000158590 [Populus alba]
MAQYAITFRLWVLSAVLVGVFIFCCNLGKADEGEYVPQTGTGIIGGVPQTGTGTTGGVPQTGTGTTGGVPQTGTGIVDADPTEIVAKALLCFSDNYVYSSCEVAYRLTETGKLNVPPEDANSYCSGPCLVETHLVLSCIENIMKHFVFYNKATIEDVRDTIKAGCGYGPERGNFDVSEHLQLEENNAFKTANQILLGVGFMFGGHALLL